ncbi:MAG: hypothetical protein QM723_17955 [Myxococcaceae bacterium]
MRAPWVVSSFTHSFGSGAASFSSGASCASVTFGAVPETFSRVTGFGFGRARRVALEAAASGLSTGTALPGQFSTGRQPSPASAASLASYSFRAAAGVRRVERFSLEGLCCD